MNSRAASAAIDGFGEQPSTADDARAPGKITTARKIGPNAILQVQDVLVSMFDKAQMQAIMHQAGLGHYLDTAPSTMVDECEVVRLHQAVRVALPDAAALAVLRKAGTQTAQYILAHRIPKPVQILLKWLPAPLASRVLLRAISQHAWTFAGSGAFAYSAGQPTLIRLTDCPACSQVYRRDEGCAYYTATLEGLFTALVHPKCTVIETRPANADANGLGSVRAMRLSW